MKPRNYYVYSDNSERLKTLKEEYESMGRSTKIEGNRLIVFARVIKPVKKKVEKKRTEDAEPRSEDRTQRSKRRD